MHRINGSYLAHEAVHYFTHADRGVFYLLSSLLRKPGEAAREYLAGRRKKYFAPLTFFLMVGAILVFSTKWFAAPPGTQAARYSSRPQATEQRTMPTRQMLNAQRSTAFFTKYSNVVTMLATPLLVAWMYLFYRRHRLNYTEHLVANLYMVGFIMLSYALIVVPLRRLYGTNRLFATSLLAAFFLFEIGYRAVSYYHLFPELKGGGGAWRAFGASLSATLVWIVLTMVSVGLFIRYA